MCIRDSVGAVQCCYQIVYHRTVDIEILEACSVKVLLYNDIILSLIHI